MASQQSTENGQDQTDSAARNGISSTLFADRGFHDRVTGESNAALQEISVTNVSEVLAEVSTPDSTPNTIIMLELVLLQLLQLVAFDTGTSAQHEAYIASIEQQLPVAGVGSQENIWEGDYDDDVDVDGAELDWPQERKEQVIHAFQAASICTDPDCMKCCFWNEIKSDLETALLNRTVYTTTTRLYRSLLSVISDHSSNCEEIFCVVPYCCFFSQCGKDEAEEQIAHLVRFYTSIDWNEPSTINSFDDGDCKFMQIDSSVRWDSIESGYADYPQVRLDYNVFDMKFGQFGKVVTSGQAFTFPPEYINIHQYMLLDDVDHRQIWSSLRHLGQHENIVRHHWVYWHSKLFTVCFDFTGSSTLQDLVINTRGQLTLRHVYFYMRQLVSAVEYLHRVDILYLLWTASSIALTANGFVKLADFSFVIQCRDTDDNEIGNVIAANLPPNIIPPEMFQSEIGKFSDVWGLGCLMYELIVGFPIHHRIIHQPRDKLRNEVQNCPFEEVRRMTSNELLRQIFTEKSQRISCSALANLINSGLQFLQ